MSNSAQRERRSTAAPMDFEFTSPSRELSEDSPFRRGIEAAAAAKRSRLEMESSPSTFYSFGNSHTNVPFLFSIPAPPSTLPPSWSPGDTQDVQMEEVSQGENDKTRPISRGALQRVYKTRRRERFVVRDSLSESGSDHDTPTDRRPSPPSFSNHYTLNVNRDGKSLSTHTPYLLIGYVQFAFNLSLVLVFLYLLTSFILTVQRDVEQRISQHSLDALQEIAHCAAAYKSNHCEQPLPALIRSCSEWEACMARDPAIVGRAKIGAGMLAEVINSFVDPISWKTLLFTLTSTAFLTTFVNSVLSLFRTRYRPGQQFYPIDSRAPRALINPSWIQEEPLELPARKRKLLSGASTRVG